MIISDDNSLVLILLVGWLITFSFISESFTGPIAMESIPLLITPGINESGKD